MLNTIKDLIKQKTAFQEAADLILENESLDDSIILLHEESDDTIAEVEDTTEKNHDTEEPEEEPAENGDDTSDEPEEKPDEVEKPEEPETSDDTPEEDDVLDAPIEDELPTPVGAQTGEPAQIGDDDLLSMEIDLVTNTPKDTLPVPPAGATDVVPGADTTRVDSGFSTADVSEEEDSRDPQAEEEAADLLDLPIDEETVIPDPNGVAKKEEKPEEKAREDATPTEKTDEFKESTDTPDESDVEEGANASDNMKKTIGDMVAKSDNKISAKDFFAKYGDDDNEENKKKEETEETDEKCEQCDNGEKAAPKTESSDKPTVKYDKMADLANMSAQQIKAAIDPGIKAKLESAGILDQFVEAISIGDDTTDDASTDNIATDTTAEEPAAEEPTDNAVTAAVKDKVDEMDASNTEPNPNASKEAILKKLGSLSKAIEDTKNLVIDSAK